MTYFLKAIVVDSDDRTNLINTESTKAYAWVKSKDHDSAIKKASFFIKKEGWKIIEWTQAIEVTRDMFLDRDLEIRHFDLSQSETCSILYVGVDNTIQEREFRELKTSYSFDINEFYKKNKSITQKKMCLHFNAGTDCNEIIKAHSIQNKNALSAIARDGHVYRIDMNKLNKTNTIDYKLVGVNKASTFSGFCKNHDNSLFEPIDNCNLIPTKQQAFLYAYRSISKELFTKQQAIEGIQSMINSATGSEAVTDNLNGMLKSFQYGTEQLESNKKLYDESLEAASFDDIRYVAFIFNENPTAVFSGLIYPDYDFQGRKIQDLGKKTSLSLMTFCSAPTDDGWAFIFSWHKSSDSACSAFMYSLQEVMRAGKQLEDYLFQLMILNCENHALSPKWWDGLSQPEAKVLCSMMEQQADIFSEIESNYLATPPLNLIDWKLKGVYDSHSM